MIAEARDPGRGAARPGPRRAGLRRGHPATREPAGFIDEVVISPTAGGGSAADLLEGTSDARIRFRQIAARLIALLNDRLIEEAVFRTSSLAEAALAAQHRPGPTSQGLPSSSSIRVGTRP